MSKQWPTITVRDHWIRIAGTLLATCSCGKPVAIIHIRELGSVECEMEAWCGSCAPIVFVNPETQFFSKETLQDARIADFHGGMNECCLPSFGSVVRGNNNG